MYLASRESAIRGDHAVMRSAAHKSLTDRSFQQSSGESQELALSQSKGQKLERGFKTDLAIRTGSIEDRTPSVQEMSFTEPSRPFVGKLAEDTAISDRQYQKDTRSESQETALVQVEAIGS